MMKENANFFQINSTQKEQNVQQILKKLSKLADFILHVTPSKFTEIFKKQYKQIYRKYSSSNMFKSDALKKNTMKTLDEVIQMKGHKESLVFIRNPSHAVKVSISIPTVFSYGTKD